MHQCIQSSWIRCLKMLSNPKPCFNEQPSVITISKWVFSDFQSSTVIRACRYIISICDYASHHVQSEYKVIYQSANHLISQSLDQSASQSINCSLSFRQMYPAFHSTFPFKNLKVFHVYEGVAKRIQHFFQHHIQNYSQIPWSLFACTTAEIGNEISTL